MNGERATIGLHRYFSVRYRCADCSILYQSDAESQQAAIHNGINCPVCSTPGDKCVVESNGYTNRPLPMVRVISSDLLWGGAHPTDRRHKHAPERKAYLDGKKMSRIVEDDQPKARKPRRRHYVRSSPRV